MEYVFLNLIIENNICSNKIFCIDVDGTICTETNGKYEECKPIQKVIDKVNTLYENNNNIIFFTSRGSKSGYNWYDFTKKQLDSWGVKYHSLFLGKPQGDIYIDDKGIKDADFFTN